MNPDYGRRRRPRRSKPAVPVSPILIPVVLVRMLTGSRLCLEISASQKDTILNDYPGWAFE